MQKHPAASDRSFRKTAVVCAALLSCLGWMTAGSEALAAGTAPSAETGKPSRLFLDTFQKARFPIAGTVLLQTTAGDFLKRNGSKCQAVSEFNGLGRIVCSDTRLPGNINGTVLFSYLPSNGLLSGIEIYFAGNQRAASDALFDKLSQSISDKYDSYSELFATAVDSPYLRLSQGRAADSGTWVRLSVSEPQRLDEFERFVRRDMTQIPFGDLTVGKTTIEQMREIAEQQDSISCTAASFNTDIEQEYVGTCFSFPFEAHYLLSFDPVTKVLTSAVLSPRGNATKTLVDEALKSRFNNSEQCRNLTTDAKVNPSGNIQEQDYAKRIETVDNRAGTVYAGVCRHPQVFEYGDHYIFNLKLVTDRSLEMGFAVRKRVNAEQSRRYQVREDRRKLLTDFFY